MKIQQYIILALLPVMLLACGKAYGQQEPQYSQYMFNQLAYNPAYAGSREFVSATMLVRKQWIGLDGSPFTGSASVHAPSRNLRHGFGASMIHDRIGIIRQNFLTASYAYRLPVGAGKLAFGLRGGVSHYSNMFSELNPLENDQINPGVNLSVFLPRVGAGLYYNTERFFMGASVPNFLESTYRFKNPMMQNTQSQQERHYFGIIGGVIPLGEKLDFRPSAVAKYAANSPAIFDLNAAIMYNKMVWLGVGYRTKDALIGLVEVDFPGGFRLGYAYDYTLSNLRQVNTGSHEIMLGIDLNSTSKKIITPRYF